MTAADRAPIDAALEELQAASDLLKGAAMATDPADQAAAVELATEAIQSLPTAMAEAFSKGQERVAEEAEEWVGIMKDWGPAGAAVFILNIWRSFTRRRELKEVKKA